MGCVTSSSSRKVHPLGATSPPPDSPSTLKSSSNVQKGGGTLKQSTPPAVPEVGVIGHGSPGSGLNNSKFDWGGSSSGGGGDTRGLRDGEATASHNSPSPLSGCLPGKWISAEAALSPMPGVAAQSTTRTTSILTESSKQAHAVPTLQRNQLDSSKSSSRLLATSTKPGSALFLSDPEGFAFPTTRNSFHNDHRTPSYHRHHSTSGDLQQTRESLLSDISDTLSSSGTAAAASWQGCSTPRFSLGNGRNSIANTLFRNSEDLESQRQHAQLNIEEDLFVYDDIVISKDEARTKHWRVAGRKATFNMEGGLDALLAAAGFSGFDCGGGLSSAEKKYFSFNDFDVCVDEMDIMPLKEAAVNGLIGLARETPTDTNLGLSQSITVTHTDTANPNTVVHFLAQRRLMEPKADRTLRDFHVSTNIGHATRVKCIALSPSEMDFVSCSNEDASITLHNFGVASEVGIFTGHQDTIINASFSPDGKYLATTSKDKSMILWDVMTTKNLLTFAHPKVVICCAFAPDSKYLVSGCQDRVCRVWDTKRGREWLSYSAHEGIIIAIAFSPDGNYVCSASADKSLRVWSATTSKTRFHLLGHIGIILSCSFTSDGRHIISNDESLLRVWSTEDGSCTLSLSPADIAGVAPPHQRGPKLGWTLSSAAPGAFTRYVLVACNNRFVYVLDRETGLEVTSVFCKAPVYCLTVGSYEKMACGDSFGNIYLLSLK